MEVCYLRIPCSLHGCKRVYTDNSALERHIQDHEIPAQSLPGELLLCSSIGCSGSFPNMQRLMQHMRHHHKPNIFFHCRTKLRSYRGLLTHLHTCSKVPRSRTKPLELTLPLPAAANHPNVTATAMDQQPPQLESVSAPVSAGPPLLGPPILPLSQASPSLLASPQLSEATHQSVFRNEALNLPSSLNLDGPKAASDRLDAQGQQQTHTWSPESFHPAPGSAPHSPPGSSAVWKKNPGEPVFLRRILWEHTRGRYTCVQCGHVVSNRKEMTQHINSQHSGSKAAEDTTNSTDNT
uniref:Zinc finger protein 414 n=1 Tax=Acanthochromis polyacanthus TaxID=80966 RepID=A0A3Q1ESU7_9TELE